MASWKLHVEKMEIGRTVVVTISKESSVLYLGIAEAE